MSTKINDYGVLLVNMGGPNSQAEIFPYLFRLFSDPLILGTPGFLRKGLAYMIAKLRWKKAAAKYALIGGHSPLSGETAKQAHKLAQLLDRPVTYAMRYTDPSIDTACRELANQGASRLIIVPLYPQYSTVTTGSVWNYINEKKNALLPFRFIQQHYDNSQYIQALSRLLNRSLEQIDTQYKTALVFVAHSLPYKLVKAGDPYVNQIEKTVALVSSEISQPLPIYLAYQSRVGPVEWQGPTLEEILNLLVEHRIQQLVVQPLSFVSENLETLYDLDIQFKNQCTTAGIKNVIRVPAPGTHPSYIEALAGLVKDRADHWETVDKPQ